MKFMHLPHIRPKKGRGRNHIEYRILLCTPCHGMKGHVSALDGSQVANSKPDAKGLRWMNHKADAQSAISARQTASKAIRTAPWNTYRPVTTTRN